ncbi:MAG: cobalamin biosynthesis protein CobD [Actinobacteria bacterium]|nr:cobalamin biosynthesis protein CobD [Actinomycetota bacterium]
MSVIVAGIVDWWLGEAPAGWHPVRWMGRYLERTGSWIQRPATDRGKLVAGGAAWLGGLTGVAVAALGIDRFITRRLPPGMQVLIRGLILKQMLSLRLLLFEVQSVETALDVSEEEGRRQVRRIVSRDTARLTSVEVRESALESLAENLADSVVAPIWWYLVAGLPGAMAFRYVNTADAMWGYRGEMEWPGKVAAVADDIANFVPARITGVLIGAPSVGPGRIGAEATKATSPNGGWPMAALALRLGVRLSKPGTYVLNPAGRPPTPGDTRSALRMAAGRSAACLMAAALMEEAGRRDR